MAVRQAQPIHQWVSPPQAQLRSLQGRPRVKVRRADLCRPGKLTLSTTVSTPPGVQLPPILRLPGKVLERIANHLASLDYPRRPFITLDSSEEEADAATPRHQALDALARTCKAFVKPVQQNLLSGISLRLDELYDFVCDFRGGTGKAALCNVKLIAFHPKSDAEPTHEDVTNFIRLTRRIELSQIVLQMVNPPMDTWQDRPIALELRRILNELSYPCLRVMGFRCSFSCILPSRPLARVDLLFDPLTRLGLVIDWLAAASKPLNAATVVLDTIICHQSTQKEQAAFRSHPEETRPFLECARAIRNGHPSTELLSAVHRYEAALLSRFCDKVVGKPKTLQLSSCRLSSPALSAIFKSRCVAEVTSLHLDNLMACSLGNGQHGSPFDLSMLPSVTDIALGAVDVQLFKGSPPLLLELSVDCPNASIGVPGRILAPQKFFGTGALASAPRLPVLVSLRAAWVPVKKDGPANTLPPAEAARPKQMLAFKQLDALVREGGHRFPVLGGKEHSFSVVVPVWVKRWTAGELELYSKSHASNPHAAWLWDARMIAMHRDGLYQLSADRTFALGLDTETRFKAHGPTCMCSIGELNMHFGDGHPLPLDQLMQMSLGWVADNGLL